MKNWQKVRHNKEGEPVRVKPIPTSVFYKGKEMSQCEGDRLATKLAKEQEQKKKSHKSDSGS